MNVLADTSAWVEYLRETGSDVARSLRRQLNAETLSVTDVIRMEVLAGAADDVHEARLASVLAFAHSIPVEVSDWTQAARFHRRCREGGETIRKLPDCLIAAVAIRADVPVLHCDKDFDVLARHTALRVYS